MLHRVALLLSAFCLHFSAAAVAGDLEDAARNLSNSLPVSADQSQRSQEGTAAATLGVGLGQGEIVAGLKEALSSGTRYAVETLGREGGFLDNPALRIPLPEQLGLIDKGLRQLGQGKWVDDFVTTLNRAAEQAVPEAAEVFAKAIETMSMDDAMKILDGAENAATEYFKGTSLEELKTRLLPIVRQATDKAGVTGAYKALQGQAKGIDLGALSGLLGAADPTRIDLDQYVTDHSLDALFRLIAEQEQKIRGDVVARSTDLLRKVFGE